MGARCLVFRLIRVVASVTWVALVTLSASLGTVGVAAADDAPTPLGALACDAIKAPADVSEACAAASKSEAILMDTHGQVLEALAVADRDALTRDHANWLTWRAPFCLAISDGPSAERPFPTTAADYACVEEDARARERFERAWLPDPAPTSLDGVYSDGWGGTLTLSGAKADGAKFRLEVVRSVAFHLGEVEGELALSADGKAATATVTEYGDPPCVLTFALSPKRVEVSESECDMYHGMRAYFGGVYRLMPAR